MSPILSRRLQEMLASAERIQEGELKRRLRAEKIVTDIRDVDRVLAGLIADGYVSRYNGHTLTVVPGKTLPWLKERASLGFQANVAATACEISARKAERHRLIVDYLRRRGKRGADVEYIAAILRSKGVVVARATLYDDLQKLIAAGEIHAPPARRSKSLVPYVHTYYEQPAAAGPARRARPSEDNLQTRAVDVAKSLRSAAKAVVTTRAKTDPIYLRNVHGEILRAAADLRELVEDISE